MTAYPLVIERQFRRSIKVEILPDRTVKVTAPRLLPQSVIDSFLHKRDRWIRTRLSRPPAKTLEDGHAIDYLGQTYHLKMNEGKANKVFFEGNYLCVEAKSPKKKLMQWLSQRAFEVLEDRVSIFAKQMSVQPGDLRVKSMRTRWGSCSSVGNLNFNWSLVMAPLPVLDYVVIHELAHIKHMDHSKAFWKVVAAYCPEYKVYVKWLRNNGSGLNCS